MSVNWNGDDDKILIEFVQLHEELYNTKHIDFRKTHLKQKLWCDIGQILKKPDSDCCQRWSYVRDYYIRRKAKSGSSGEAARKRAELLSFLDNFPSSQRNSTYNIDKVENVTNNPYNCVITQIDSEETKDMTNDMIKIEYNEEDSVEDTIGNEDSNRLDSLNVEDVYKQAFNSDVDSNMQRQHKTSAKERIRLKQIARRVPRTRELDETDLFFRSMAKIVKKLPKYEQAQLRMEIGSLVGNAELRHISD